MNDLDAMLARVRGAPTPARLAMLDRTVMENLAHLEDPPGAGVFGMALAIALIAGIAGSAFPTASPPVRTPFDASLAPSTLLSLR